MPELSAEELREFYEMRELLYGNERSGRVGMVKRLADTEAQVETLEQQKRDQKILIRGLTIGLSLVGAGGGILQGFILNVLQQLASRGL